MKVPVNVAVVGATGAVGRTMLRLLAERDFPVGELYALASARSAGTRLVWRDREVRVQDLDSFDFHGVEVALFSAGGSISKQHAPRAAAAGAVVIDNTSCFRYDDDVPLVVPEVNPQAIAGYRERGIVANPNCSTIQLVVALKPIYDAVGIERLNIATYQAVSGAGQKGIDELQTQTRQLLAGESASDPVAFGRQIAFNAVPHIDEFLDNGYTREEMKMVWETRKILGDPQLQVNPTAVRIPVVTGHSEAVHVETRQRLTAAQALELFAAAPGVTVIDERRAGGYPTAATDGAGSDRVFVGRVREDISHPRGICFWVVSDNLRKGAATNSVQIAELLVA